MVINYHEASVYCRSEHGLHYGVVCIELLVKVHDLYTQCMTVSDSARAVSACGSEVSPCRNSCSE